MIYRAEPQDDATLRKVSPTFKISGPQKDLSLEFVTEQRLSLGKQRVKTQVTKTRVSYRKMLIIRG